MPTPTKRAEKPVRTVKKTAAVTRKRSTGIAGRLLQFLTLKHEVEQQEERLGTIKKDLSATVEEDGYTDDKGNYWFDLDEPVEFDGKTYRRIKREARVSERLDEETAETILRKKGLYDECTTTIVVLDEEAISKAYFQKRLSAADMDKMFPKTTTWAFKPIAGK